MHIIDEKIVVNAKKSVILHITDGDISKAKKKKPDSCAAAIACRRQMHVAEARVHLGRTYLRNNGKWVRYLTSDALRSELIAFDKGGKFEPGDYPIYRIQPSKATGKQQGSRKYKKRSHIYHRVIGVRPSSMVA
jgi:hypothetical protein